MNLTFAEFCSLLPAGTQIVNPPRERDLPDFRAAGFAIDSRNIAKNEIFVAIKTRSRDGHDFVPAAIAAGASAALVERKIDVPVTQFVVPAGTNSVEIFRQIAANYRQKFLKSVPVIGVTGSVGKTSTKDMLAHVLAGTRRVFSTPKNLNNTLGVPLNICKIDPREHEIAVIEMGTNAPGEIAISAAVAQPNFAIVTNICPVHLEGLGTLDGIAREKSAIAANADCCAIFYKKLLKFPAFHELSTRGNAIIVDDDSVNFVPAKNGYEISVSADIFENSTRKEAKFLTSPSENLPNDKISNSEVKNFASLRAKNPVPAGEKFTFFIPSPSLGQARNAALIVALAQKFVPAEILRSRLATWQPSQNRGEWRVIKNGFRAFIDCYNASPISMLDSVAAFQLALADDPAPRLYVLGGMGELGENSEQLHFDVGAKLPLSRERDFLALFGGNASFIGDGLAGTHFPRERIFNFPTIDALRDFVSSFRGHLMFKGSRAFALERAVPET